MHIELYFDGLYSTESKRLQELWKAVIDEGKNQRIIVYDLSSQKVKEKIVAKPTEENSVINECCELIPICGCCFVFHDRKS